MFSYLLVVCDKQDIVCVCASSIDLRGFCNLSLFLMFS